ncbi:hypothetical protein Lal_00001996 [Lupinus albus]|uniref:Dof zinc finger protein n=1 Tax=Lupinus albus TaxID=3870 RepID=A0A6A5P926_LUPAL|nr:putative transcription factor C2C2-Dof family [Lupinus albus]KAF1893512.1 hypothetical protein Lal_00001996 [Lupinus albus]
MDTGQWAQGMEDSSKAPQPPILERSRARPQKDQALNCPRCNSINTKFCYYNNYSLSQPRYFCKTCRRYWTEGGSLRNVPVGGGSRKNKGSISSSSTTPTSNNKLHDLSTQPNNNLPDSVSHNPKIHQGQDLNIAYPPLSEDYNTISKFIEVPFSPEDKGHTHHLQNPSSSAIKPLKTGITTTSFMPMSLSDSTTMYNSAGFPPLQEFIKPGLDFSLEGFENGYGGGLHGIQQDGTSGARILFPPENLKQQQVQNTDEFHNQNRNQGNSTGYWNGMLGGGSW